MEIVCVAGARPNFVKVAPLMRAFAARPGVEALLVHTGQHYDEALSRRFFEDLAIPEPDVNLEVGSGSHAVQTARVMERFEPVLLARRPDVVVVVGDVNSTLACALTAVKLGVAVAHVEAGLRSFDRSMPEEINRILTDAISTFLFTSEPSANANLVREGIDPTRIHFVGNVMIDSLLALRGRADESRVLDRLGVGSRAYGVLTLHRPATVDRGETLREVLSAIAQIARELPMIFPCHPRTRARLTALGLGSEHEGLGGIRLVDPLGYLDFLKLMADARVVLTDSGGIQEETTVLGVPCVTLRDTTERPVTVTHGTNVLAGHARSAIVRKTLEALNRGSADAPTPSLWDGRAAERVADVLLGLARRQALAVGSA